MSELVFLPTPNWFISRPIDVNGVNGSIAITAINTIIVTNRLFDEYNFSIKDAHTKRLQGVSFSQAKSSDANLLASCADDYEIRVWNLNARSENAALLHNQHKFHQNSPTCLDWLRFTSGEEHAGELILLSCDVKGNIYKWNLNTNEHVRYFPENKPITQIRSRADSYTVAVGYKQGTIVILDVRTDQMKIQHKLKTHQDSINCLCWCLKGTQFNKLPADDMTQVLCSSSEDKTIKLWCALKGTELKSIRAPGGQQQTGSQQNKINYTAVCWPSGGPLMSASFKGELYHYDSDADKWCSFVSPAKVEHLAAHKKIIYDISSHNGVVFTLSLDRLINIWNLNDFHQQMSITTLNGFVYSISSSPIDPDYLAISMGDGSIKFMSEKHYLKNGVKLCKSYSNNIKSEVTQVSWHPTKESIIAFGTKDGKVGVADIMTSNRPAQYVFTNYSQSIYTLEWSVDGILAGDSGAKRSYLYSVADGRIMQHSFQLTTGAAPVAVNSIENVNFYQKLTDDATDTTAGLTEFCFQKKSADKAYVLVGKSDGSMELFSVDGKTARRLCVFYNHQKLITCIKLNANATLVASGSNDFNVIVVDFAQLIQDESTLANAKLFAKYKHKLVGHRERVTGLNWCKLDGDGLNLLASCSYDSTVQIWNAMDGVPLANYRGHSDKLLCCLFSNVDANRVYSGGEDMCLQVWKIDAQLNKTPPEQCPILIGKKRTKLIKKQDKQQHHHPQQQQQQTTQAESKKAETENEPPIDENSLSEAFEPEETPPQTANETKSVKKTISKATPTIGRELKSLFQLSGPKSLRSRLHECVVLFEALYDENDKQRGEIHLRNFDFPSNCPMLNLLGNRSSVCGLLNLEEAELKKIQYDKWWIFEAWKGNIARVMGQSRANKQIDDALFTMYEIAVNSTRDPQLLDEYIEQLSASRDPEHTHKAVLYALACSDPQRAIQTYLNAHMYPYALAIGHLRLAPNDPLLDSILLKYALHATLVGDFETAIQCYIRLNDIENALKLILRRNAKNDPECEQLIQSLTNRFENLIKKSNFK